LVQICNDNLVSKKNIELEDEKFQSEYYFETRTSNQLGMEARNYIHSNNFEINLKFEDGEYSDRSDQEKFGSKSDRIMLEHDYLQLSEEGPGKNRGGREEFHI